MKTNIKHSLVTATALVVLSFFTGCSSNNESSSATNSEGVESTGFFVDSAVEGLDYKSSETGFTGFADPRGFSGKTNAAGEYKFNGGDVVRFSLGDIILGELEASTSPVSPVDLFADEVSSSQKVVNIARLLQSLDADGQPGNGITILDESVKTLTTLVGCVVGQECAVDLSTYDETALKELLDEVVLETLADDRVVSEDYALDHLATTLGDSAMIRKNISKTAELHSSKPKMNMMSIYVDAQAADGTPVYADESNTTRLRVHPIVSTYADSVEGAEFIWDGVTPAHDTFAAISLDDGATFKRINLSRTATRSSFKLKNGKDYPGDSHKPVMQARGNNILVVWDDKFCKSGNPMELVATDDNGVVVPDVTLYDGNVTYEEDIYLVNGSQDSVDYATISVNGDYPYTEVGEVPYGCVMASRTVINPDAETPEEVITTYVAEQITTGRRDALQIFLASSPGGQGFGFTWQEDPEGLRPGAGKGPGAGWGGATTNHKTDIWYSYMLTSNFAAIDEDFVSSGDVDQDQIVTDAEDTEEEVTTRPHALNNFSLPVRISNNAVCSEESVNAGTGAAYCAQMCEKYGVYNNSADAEDPANGKCYGPGIDPITGEPFVLDGDTGASRPNIFIQPGKFNGEPAAIAIFGYEETKGLGDGAPEDSGIPTEGVDDTNWTDTGKYVIYESFPFDRPEVLGDATDLDHVVSGGNILNLPNSEGIYENARRIRFIPQGMKSMETAEEDIVLAAVYKEGMEGQGRPSDIMLARWKGGYGIEKVVEGRINISSVSPTVTDEDANTTKVLEWEWTPANLADESATNPYDDARAHRGQIRGDFLIVGYSYTPNWAAARIANDKYDFYVRRSFDGGKTWTKADGNTSEGPVNVSNLANNKETVIEPRLVATPGTILVDGVLVDPKDKQNKNIYFITYGTAENIPNVVGSVDEDTDVSAGAPLDLYYARTTDRGETYEMVEQTITSEESNLTGETIDVMDWFAHSDAEEGEVQIRMTPDGTVFYGSWIQELALDADTNTPDHFRGSDIWFRKIDYNLVVDDTTEE